MSGETKTDERFGATALSLGLITQGQLEDAIQVQKNMDALGIKESLQNVLMKKGFINQAQAAQVLRTMGVQVQPIPGYHITSRLGQGGMGTVYKAKQLSMERTVALKVLNAQATEGKNFVDRFFREAQAAARLNHKNIIRAYDAGCANGIYYFVMEYVEGTTVKHLIDKEGKIDERRALHILEQAAEALEYLNQNSMIHRDIKPENIMLDKEGNAKLCDFGLAKQITGDQSVTKAGFTFGTPYYMSPEQINGRKDLDIRSDLYSLGASFYHMLTGHTPFEGKDLREVLTKHLTEPAPSPIVSVPSLSERTCKIALKMLEKDRKHRYQSPAQLIEDLGHVKSGQDPVHARKVRRPSRAPLVGIAAVALAVLGVGGGLYYSLVLNKPKRNDPPPIARPNDKPPAEPPKPIASTPDPRDVEADALYADARKLQDDGKFEEAKAKYSKLDKEYFNTDTFQKNRGDIWARMAECQNKIDVLAAAQKREEAAKGQELRDKFKQANAAYLKGDWEQTRALCEELLQEPTLPDGFDRPALNSMRERSQKELAVAGEWPKVEELAKQGRWAEFLTKLKAFNENYGSTQAIVPLQRDMTRYEVTAGKEIAAAKAIEELRGLAAKNRWDEIRARAPAVARDHGETTAYKAAKAEIDEYLARNTESPAVPPPPEGAPAGPSEAKAKDALAKADALFDAKKYPEAGDAYDKFMADFSETKTAKEAQARIEKNRDAIAKAKESDRDKTAMDMYKQARALFNKKNFKDAAPLFESLQNDYQDVKSIKGNKELAKMAKECKKRVELAEREVFDNFESGKLDGWWNNDRAGKKIFKENVKEGDHALALWFGEHKDNPSEGNWPCVLRKVDRELPAETSMITFWACVDRKEVNAKMWIEVRTGEGKDMAVYAVEKLVTPKWQQMRIYFSEFKLIWGGENLQRAKAHPPLDITKIRAIGFSEVNPMGEMAFLVDDLRFEFYYDR